MENSQKKENRKLVFIYTSLKRNLAGAVTTPNCNFFLLNHKRLMHKPQTDKNYSTSSDIIERYKRLNSKTH